MSSARLQSIVGGCRRETFRFDEVLYSDEKLAVTPSVLIVRESSRWKSWIRYCIWGTPLGEEEYIIQNMGDVTLHPEIQRSTRERDDGGKWNIHRKKKKKQVAYNVSIEMQPVNEYAIHDRWSWSSATNRWPSSLSSLSTTSQLRSGGSGMKDNLLLVLAEHPEQAVMAIEKAKQIFY